MILSYQSRENFKLLQKKVSHAMALYDKVTPYFLDNDPVIQKYEMTREVVWVDNVSIQKVCKEYKLSRRKYYEVEAGFKKFGVIGFFPEIKPVCNLEKMERLLLLLNDACPALSEQAIVQAVKAFPQTREIASKKNISLTCIIRQTAAG